MTPEEAFEGWLNSGKVTHTDCSMHDELYAAWLAAWHQGRAAGLGESQELIEELHAYFIEDSDICQWGRRVVEKLKNRRAAAGET